MHNPGPCVCHFYIRNTVLNETTAKKLIWEAQEIYYTKLFLQKILSSNSIKQTETSHVKSVL